MRVTTNMIHSQSLASMEYNNTKLYKTLQQITSGQRVNSPSDDPVAATLALGVTQSRTINTTYRGNQQAVGSALRTVESQLTTVGDALHTIRARLVEAGDGAFNDNDIRTLSYDVKELLGEILGLANSKDSQGNFLFSGFQSGLQPFVSASGEVRYQGDQGQRLLQVGESRFLPTTYDGSQLFMSIPTGNGIFEATDNVNNRGSGVISPNGVTNVDKWDASSKNFTIRFAVDSSNLAPDGPVYKYDIIDNVTGNSILSGVPSTGTPDNPGAYWRVYHPGDTIDFVSQGAEPPFDYGMSVKMDGQPTAYLINGVWGFDEFTVKETAPQSVFATLNELISRFDAKRDPASEPTPWEENPALNGNTPFMNAITQALQNVDNAMDRVLKLRTEIGTHLNEAESLISASLDMDVIYADNLSALIDVDYASAISDFSRYQLFLEAAQKSFAQVSKLSLFNYI